ncbi:MAG: hypothetical protein E7182_00190 [Erysipelotrichaceae bacterium]|nr:hypothetical protein [Erysipelotrichaceae bacterium]
MPAIKINFVPEEIGPFHQHHANKTSMKHGFYYEMLTELPFAKDKRHIRVWLPDSYDFYGEGHHPVLYMSDGQNLVDKYLTRYGDWHLDRVIATLRKEGYPEPILVGIDCPKDSQQRSNELNPPYPVLRRVRKKEGAPKRPIGDQFIAYIVEKLKPLIDETFHTDPRKECTGIGGSSMGGIMSFYAWLCYPKTFGYSHCFSPPFFFYNHRQLRRILKTYDPRPETHGRIFLYVGGKDFEKTFTKGVFWMHKELEKFGYGSGTMGFAYEEKAIHHEEWWYRYSFPALRFWLSELPKE